MITVNLLTENLRLVDAVGEHGRDQNWSVLDTKQLAGCGGVVTNFKCHSCSAVHCHREGHEWPWIEHKCKADN